MTPSVLSVAILRQNMNYASAAAAAVTAILRRHQSGGWQRSETRAISLILGPQVNQQRKIQALRKEVYI
jgi:hypothetical protein